MPNARFVGVVHFWTTNIGKKCFIRIVKSKVLWYNENTNAKKGSAMDSYIFDKRKMKKMTIKYGLIAVGLFVTLLLVYYGLSFTTLSSGAVLVLLVVTGLMEYALIEWLIYAVKNRHEKEKNKDVVVVKAGALGKKKKTYVTTHQPKQK